MRVSTYLNSTVFANCFLKIFHRLTHGKYNKNLIKVIKSGNFKIDEQKCLENKLIEDHILNDRIEGVKSFNINSTPTLLINGKKFEKSLTYKNLKKAIEKLL